MLIKKTQRPQQAQPVQNAQARGPGRRFTDSAGELDTVIGPGLCIKGTIEGRSNVELKGTLEGPCRIDGLFWQRPGATLIGELQATNVILEGAVQGQVFAREKIELRSTCKVQGEIQARSVAMAEGSFFEGKIHMTAREGGGHPTTFRETRNLPAAPEETPPKKG